MQKRVLRRSEKARLKNQGYTDFLLRLSELSASALPVGVIGKEALF